MPRFPFASAFVLLLLVSSSETLAQKTDASGTVVLCDSNNPPYTAGVETGELAHGGTVVDLVTQVFSRIDRYEVEVRIYPWVRCLMLARRGEVDGVLKLLRKDERAEYLEFSRPIYASVQRLFYLRERFPEGVRWNRLTDLAGSTFGIVKDASYGEELDRALAERKLRFEIAGSDRQNLEKLVAGRVDLVPTNELFAREHLESLGAVGEVAKSEQVTWSRDVHIGIAKESAHVGLLPTIDRILDELDAEVGLASIVDPGD